jgi:chromate transporter
MTSEPTSLGSRAAGPPNRLGEVLRIFLRLGCTSFGGPIAHLGYFRTEFVARRQWLDEVHYADLVALCQFLPGPASSRVAVSLGILRAGLAGGIAAWIGFSAPSALALVAFAAGVARLGALADAAWHRKSFGRMHR